MRPGSAVSFNEATGRFVFTDTGHFNIIAADGTVVGRVSTVEHSGSNGNSFSFDSATAKRRTTNPTQWGGRTREHPTSFEPCLGVLHPLATELSW